MQRLSSNSLPPIGRNQVVADLSAPVVRIQAIEDTGSNQPAIALQRDSPAQRELFIIAAHKKLSQRCCAGSIHKCVNIQVLSHVIGTV